MGAIKKEKEQEKDSLHYASHTTNGQHPSLDSNCELHTGIIAHSIIIIIS